MNKNDVALGIFLLMLIAFIWSTSLMYFSIMKTECYENTKDVACYVGK